MSEQLEFGFVHTAKRREQLLLEVEFGKRRNSVLLAAIMREIAKYPPGKCYPSQATLGKAFKVHKDTIGRAIKALGDLDLVAVLPQGREFHDGHKTINHYFINWTALEQRVAKQTGAESGSKTPEAIRQPDVVSTDTAVEVTDTAVSPDRHGSCAAPIRQLDPTDTAASCRPIELIEKQIDQTTTNGKSVVVGGDEDGFSKEDAEADAAHDPSWTPTETNRIRDTLFAAKVISVEQSIKAAKARGWSVRDVDAIIKHWQDNTGMSPNVLANWLLKDGSPPPEILRGVRLKQLQADITLAEKQRNPEAAANTKRSGLKSDGCRRGLPTWMILATTGRALEMEFGGEYATDDERIAAHLLDRFDALRAQSGSNAELQPKLRRLARDVGDMPVSQVDSELAELERSTAVRSSDQSSTANIEAGTTAREEQICRLS